MKKLIIGLSVACLSSIACSPSVTGGSAVTGGWSQTDKDGFLKSCTANASSAYCECSLTELQKKYPNIKDIANVSISEMTTIITPCIPKK